VQFEERVLGRVLHQAGTTHLIEVELNGERITTLLREVDREPITTRIRHVSLWAMAMDEPIETEVPIVLEGESLALKSGGVLIHPVEKLRVKCLPTQIPEAIHVDTSPRWRTSATRFTCATSSCLRACRRWTTPTRRLRRSRAPKGVAEEEVTEETVGEG
jgi:ribosomal protein bL25 (Ctc-form)